MFDGLDHVWKAVRILVQTDESLKDRLDKAASEFFVSTIQMDEWPHDLIEKVTSLDARLQKRQIMSDAEMRQAAIDLVDLSSRVDAARLEDNRRNRGN